MIFLLTYQINANQLLETRITLQNIERIYSEKQDIIESLWQEPAIRAQFEKRFDYHVFDGAPHFFLNSDLKRFRLPSYEPTLDDIIFCRKKTTGIIETSIKHDGHVFFFHDVGGQRSERRKWRERFQTVDAIIFVVSVSDFNELCYEDEQLTRFMDCLDLFDQTINSELFHDTPVIILFNVCLRFLQLS
jgi:guanine nucleotide-binding protein G(i) subunit alpha